LIKEAKIEFGYGGALGKGEVAPIHRSVLYEGIDAVVPKKNN